MILFNRRAEERHDKFLKSKPITKLAKIRASKYNLQKLALFLTCIESQLYCNVKTKSYSKNQKP